MNFLHLVLSSLPLLFFRDLPHFVENSKKALAQFEQDWTEISNGTSSTSGLVIVLRTPERDPMTDSALGTSIV